MYKRLFYIAGISILLVSCSSGIKLTEALKPDSEAIKRLNSTSRLEHTVALAPIALDTDFSLNATEQPTKSDTEKPLQIDKAFFSDKLREVFQTNNVFKGIENLSAEATSKKFQIKEARNKKATLLMNVSIKKSRVYYLGKNSSALGNTLMWFMLGIPSLWGSDKDYGVEIIAQVSFFDIASSSDFATQVISFELPFKVEGGLNYLERSSGLTVLAMPPQFCSDDLDKIETLIAKDAQEQFLIKLAEQAKKEFPK